jgi:hypothetical protein
MRETPGITTGQIGRSIVAGLKPSRKVGVPFCHSIVFFRHSRAGRNPAIKGPDSRLRGNDAKF